MPSATILRTDPGAFHGRSAEEFRYEWIHVKALCSQRTHSLISSLRVSQILDPYFLHSTSPVPFAHATSTSAPSQNILQWQRTKQRTRRSSSMSLPRMEQRYGDPLHSDPNPMSSLRAFDCRLGTLGPRGLGSIPKRVLNGATWQELTCACITGRYRHDEEAGPADGSRGREAP